MIGSPIKTLKEEIIELLLKQSCSSKRLLTWLKEKEINVTIQAVYKQLNILLESEVVLKNKQQYTVSNEWIQNVSKMINVQDVELPEEGEKFTYKFNSLQNLDAHWKHVTEAMNQRLASEPIFLYSYHQFWIYTPKREESEKQFATETLNKNKYTFYVIGGVTELDKKYKKDFNTPNYKIEIFSIKSLKEKEHLFVIGDLIVNVKIPEGTSKEINSIYKQDTSTAQKEKKLREILGREHKALFTIENNKQKAMKIKKKISQPFVLPEEIKKKIT